MSSNIPIDCLITPKQALLILLKRLKLTTCSRRLHLTPMLQRNDIDAPIHTQSNHILPLPDHGQNLTLVNLVLIAVLL